MTNRQLVKSCDERVVVCRTVAHAFPSPPRVLSVICEQPVSVSRRILEHRGKFIGLFGTTLLHQNKLCSINFIMEQLHFGVPQAGA